MEHLIEIVKLKLVFGEINVQILESEGMESFDWQTDFRKDRPFLFEMVWFEF